MTDRGLSLAALRALGNLGVRQPSRDLSTRVGAALEREIQSELDCGRHRRQRPLRPTFGSIAIAASVFLAVGVAVGAITLLQHRDTSSHPSASSAGGLIARLAVLRRPQNASDVLPARLKLAHPGITIIPSLSRLVASPPGARLYLVVSAPPTGQSARALTNPGPGDRVSIQTVTRSSGAVETPAIPAADLNDADDIIPGGDFARNARGQIQRTVYRDLYDAGVVPDGVARVRWTFTYPNGRPGRVIDATVTNNVAYTPLLPSTAVLLSATWYAADGRVIRTYDRALETALAEGIHPAVPDANVALPVLGSSKTMTLAGLHGKVVVLNFFASWCDPCKAETPILERTQRQLVGQDATILRVAYLDNASDAERYVRQDHINYPVVRDVTGNVARAFDANGIPETFIIDRQGRVVALRPYQLTGRWLDQAVHRVLSNAPN